MGLEFKNGGYT